MEIIKNLFAGDIAPFIALAAVIIAYFIWSIVGARIGQKIEEPEDQEIKKVVDKILKAFKDNEIIFDPRLNMGTRIVNYVNYKEGPGGKESSFLFIYTRLFEISVFENTKSLYVERSGRPGRMADMTISEKQYNEIKEALEYHKKRFEESVSNEVLTEFMVN